MFFLMYNIMFGRKKPANVAPALNRPPVMCEIFFLFFSFLHKFVTNNPFCFHRTKYVILINLTDTLMASIR